MKNKQQTNKQTKKPTTPTHPPTLKLQKQQQKQQEHLCRRLTVMCSYEKTALIFIGQTRNSSHLQLTKKLNYQMSL